MADRRSDDSPVAPPRSLAGPGTGARSGSSQGARSSQQGRPRGGSGDPEATQRTEPVLPPPPEQGQDKPRSKGAERIAAIVQASKTGDNTRSQAGRPPRRVRRARLRLTHIDPWSVMKTAFLLSIAVGIVTVVAVAIVWTVLGAAGVWSSIDATVTDVVGDNGSSFSIEDYLGMSRVLGFTMIIAVIDVVLVTVIATLGAFLYNLAAALLGGIEVVLAEEDR
jgi:hypothetical protein